MILGKIDVTKIDEGKYFRGKKGTYLDFVLIETPDSQYGDDYMVVQGVSKEEREKGVKGAVLGNARIFGARPAPQAQSAPAEGWRAGEESQELADDDIPF